MYIYTYKGKQSWFLEKRGMRVYGWHVGGIIMKGDDEVNEVFGRETSLFHSRTAPSCPRIEHNSNIILVMRTFTHCFAATFRCVFKWQLITTFFIPIPLCCNATYFLFFFFFFFSFSCFFIPNLFFSKVDLDRTQIWPPTIRVHLTNGTFIQFLRLLKLKKNV